MVKQLPTIERIMKETMRLHTPVPTVFGIPKQDVEIQSSTGRYLVKKGQLMQGVLTWANQNPRVFDEANIFNPGRFEDPQAGRNLVWAAGRDSTEQPEGTNHMCAGRDVVYQVMTLFLAKVLRYRWTLSETPDWGTGFSAASRPITPVNATSFVRR